MATAHQIGMSRSATRARLGFHFSVSDVVFSNPDFYGSDSHFIYGFEHGGTPYYPIVLDWGVLERNMDIQSASIMLAADAWWVSASGTIRKRVAEWCRLLNLRDVQIVVTQWDEESKNGVSVWVGIIADVASGRTVNGVPAIELVLLGENRDMAARAVSDVVLTETFASAPQYSIGGMVPVAYGWSEDRLSLAVGDPVGYLNAPMMGTPGIVIDEDETNAKFLIRFLKGDGASDSAHTFSEPGNNDPVSGGNLWVYDPGMGVYGVVDKDSYSVTNDTNKLEILIDAAPYVMFYIPPSAMGDDTSAALQTDMNKLIDGDLSNGVLTTSTAGQASFEVPTVSITGRIERVWMLVDWSNEDGSDSKQLRFGIWDDFRGAAGDWLNTKYQDTALESPGIRRISATTSLLGSSNGYIPEDFNDHDGADTSAEMQSGRFVTNDSPSGQKPLELKAACIGNGGTDNVRIHGMMLVAKMRYNLNRAPVETYLQMLQRKLRDGEITIRDYVRYRQLQPVPLDDPRQRGFLWEGGGAAKIVGRGRGTDFFITGARQKDDGSGTWSGAVNGIIQRPCDIAAHLLVEHLGSFRNNTPGTLGNFQDARGSLLGQMSAIECFGPEEMKRGEAIDSLCGRWPMSIYINQAGAHNVIPDDMNPHESRLYRSTSEVVKITADDFELDSFTWRTRPTEDIVNSVVLKYGHGYPNREARYTKTYDHKLSQKYFGKKAVESFENPNLVGRPYTGGEDDGAIEYAQWLGRRSAMPLISCFFKGTKKLYDLERGHVLMLDGLEDYGIPCPLFRDGLVYYHFNATASSTDLSNSSSYNLIATTTSALYLCFPKQTDNWTFPNITVAANYTSPSNMWKYFNDSGSWTAFGDANTTNKDALKSTGRQTVRVVRPNPTAWWKGELTFGAFGVAGPGYWVKMDYTSGTTAGSCTGRVETETGWDGIRFTTMRASRVPSGQRGYMACGIALQETY